MIGQNYHELHGGTMKHSAEKEKGILISCLMSQLVWLGSAIVLLLLLCAAAYLTDDPDAVTFPLSLCALYLSAIIGGAAAVRFSGDGIMSGALSGLITSLIVFMLSALPLPDSSFTLPLSLAYTALVIPASVIGSVIGRRKPKTAAQQHAKIHKARNRK